jgi:ssDNA-binding Zn-finger/Zn-ribbon topoisomerase 1
MKTKEIEKTSGRFGLNIAQRTNCPKCGGILPVLRNPKTMKQALWGGWTCPNCGIKVDKWGTEVKS